MPAQPHRPVTRTVVGALVGALVLAAGVVGVDANSSTAYAGSRQVSRQGHCSGPATWRLEARKDEGRIEVRGEVDTRRGDRRWRWRILHDGGVSARGITTSDGGGFSVRRLLVDARGTDRIGWRARNLRGGQVCRGGLRI